MFGDKTYGRMWRCCGLVMLGAVVVALSLGDAQAQGVQRDGRDFDLGCSIEILANMMREFEVGYVDDVEAGELLQAAASGMIAATDPYSEYLSESDMEEFEILTTGRYAGVGSLIRKKGDYVIFAQPYKGSPADVAGVKIGDKIVAIDGHNMKGCVPADVSARLKGEPETDVQVVVERNKDGRLDTLTLRRRRISIPSVPYGGYIRDGIGYIVHNDFIEGSYNEMRGCLEQLLAADSLRGLVLDYRGNGGGIMREAVDIASLFMPRGQRVVSIMGRDSSSLHHFVTEHQPLAVDVPIVVLVGGSSASASEILAGALQDNDRAVIMGQRTYGKGLVQGTRHVGYNSYLKYTTAKYYIPSGRCIQSRNYSSKGGAGSTTMVPDSLISEFRTRGGRKVYDGGGIVPDVKTEPQYVSRFALTLYAMGFMEDWADKYVREHDIESVNVRNFALTDADYEDFCNYIKECDVPYESETRRALVALEKAAENDRYNELLGDAIAELRELVKDDKMSNMQTYRSEIQDALAADVVLRYAYSSGVAEFTAVQDPLVEQAIALLLDAEQYNKILEEQDLEMH